MPIQRPRKHYVDTARGLVHVQERGDGPALVLVTITSFAPPLMDDVLVGLAALGWRALAIDLMGYGRSDKRSTPWRVEDFADNLLEAIAACAVEPVGLVCGHFSCWTGIEIASRRPHALPSLRGLVLDGTPRYTPAQRAEMQAAGTPPPQPWDEQGTHALAYWNKVWRILHRVDPLQPLDSVPTRRFREAVMALMEASVYEPSTAVAAAHFELERKLPEVELPTLAMCSDTDWNLPHHDFVISALPQALTLRLPGVHPMHDLHQPQRSGEYVELLHRFFSAL